MTPNSHPIVIIIAMIAIVIATLTTNIAANVISPANDFANLWPERIGFRTGFAVSSSDIRDATIDCMTI